MGIASQCPLFFHQIQTMRRFEFTIFSLLFVFTIALFGCGYEANEGATNQTVAEAADTIVPAADETDGADNVKGYHTVQMSTDYEDLMPMPPAVIQGDNTLAAYYPGEAVFDFSPNRYVFRYLIPNTEASRKAVEKKMQQPPLFKASCAGAEVPLDCSNAAYLAYNKSKDTPLDRLVYAYITLAEDGKLERVDHIQVPNESPCQQCEAKARGYLTDLPQWSPGQVNGSAVKTQLILPVKL